MILTQKKNTWVYILIAVKSVLSSSSGIWHINNLYQQQGIDNLY